MKQNILVVEDDALTAEDIKEHLQHCGYAVSATLASAEEALALLEGTRPDLVLMDIVLAGQIDGIDAAAAIKSKYRIPVVYLTAYTDREKLDRARLTEPYGYLVKPFDEHELRTTIDMALYRAEMDRCLRQSQRWTQAVLASGSDGVLTVDRGMGVTYMNRAAEVMLGRPLTEVLGKKAREALVLEGESDRRKLELAVSGSGFSAENASVRFEAMLTPALGAKFPVATIITPIRYDDGAIEGALIAFRDVTLERRRREDLQRDNAELERAVLERTRLLAEAKERAEAASKVKSRFLSIVGHELKTPLNPAINYAMLLAADAGLSETQRANAAEIVAACRKLLGLVENLLEMTHGETSAMPRLREGPFQLQDVIERASQMVRADAEKRGLQFSAVLPDQPPPIVVGDMQSILRALNSLLENALKFTRAGQVTLKLEVEPHPQACGTIRVRFSVEDSGPGITAEEQAWIFDPFFQVDDSLSRRHGGMGIGLAVAKRLVEAMGGKIGVESTLGLGSRFWIELPLSTGEGR